MQFSSFSSLVDQSLFLAEGGVTFPVEITSTKVVNNQRFNNVSTKLQRITKNIPSASTWNFTHMIHCVESRDKGLCDNNNVTPFLL